MIPPDFQRRTLFWLVAVSFLSLGLAFYFMATDPGIGPRTTTGANSYSDSAIGHSAFKRLLRRLEYRVSVSGYNSADKIGLNGALVLAEPTARIDRDEDLVNLLAASRLLIVLPKRSGFERTRNPRWLAQAPLLAEAKVNNVIDAIEIEGEIVRRGAGSYAVNKLGPRPTIAEPQLIRGSNLKPLVAIDGDILVGEISTRKQHIVVISDPDILANHGLDEGENAALAIAVLNHLLGPFGSIVFDEAIHGFKVTPSLWSAVFNPPFLAATLLGLVACGVLLWSATGRFGAPRALPPALAPGKEGLIANTASLLLFGGRTGGILERYMLAMRLEVCARLHAPANLGTDILDNWLTRVGEQRGVTIRYDHMARETMHLAGQDKTGQRAWNKQVAAARRVYQWKQEILNES